MSKKNESWGIEVGANAIKAIHLIRKKGGELGVVDYDMIPFKKVLTSPDLNVDEAIQVGLDQFLSRHSVAKTTVMVSVPGHMAFARFAKLPPVDPKRINDIVRFEAVQQIPFPIDQVEWDFQVFSNADSPDVSVGIVAITKERVNQFLANYKAVGLNVDGLTLSPLAVHNALTFDLDLTSQSPGTIIMDIGTSSTDVIIYENGQIWMRTLPLGGNNFTDALVRSFKLSFAKAERLKRDAGTSKYARQIFQAMRPVFADLVQELQRSLGFYQSINRDANLTRLIGVGSTFRLRGMQKFLKQQLQMEVIRPDGFKRIHIDGPQEAEFAENSINFATAYGLAIQGLSLESVSVNIMPRVILKQRLWRAKNPWFIAASVAMLFSTGAAFARLEKDRSDYQTRLAETDNQLKQVMDKASALVAKWNEVGNGKDLRARIENLRHIIDYRDVWPKLMNDIDQVAKSLDPQDALCVYTPPPPPPEYDVYGEIRKIPRAERRRIYIESMRTDYRFAPVHDSLLYSPPPAPVDPNAPATPEATTTAPAAPDPSAPRLLTLPGRGRAGGTVVPGAKKKKSRVEIKWPETDPSPIFTVSIKGTTPYADAAILLGTNYINWLIENADRGDRPYRILAKGASLETLRRKTEESVVAITPNIHPVAGIGGKWGAGAGQSGPGGPGGQIGGSANGPDPLFTRPVYDVESDKADYEFVISWEIQLVTPDVARQTSDYERPSVKPATPGSGAPSNSTPKPNDPLSLNDVHPMEDRS